MVHVPCAKCKKETTNDGDVFECDACSMQYHLTCDTVKKGDVTARTKSKNLKLYCTRCMSGKLEIANAEKLSIIYKYVTKIDMQTQKQVEIQTDTVAKLDSIIAESGDMKKKMDDVQNRIETQTHANTDKEKNKSYANVVRSAAKPTVMIKPKCTAQNATTTSDDIKTQINCKDVNACGMRKLHDGGIIVSCETDAESMKMKTMIEEKFGDKYDVQLPTTLKPRVKVFKVDGIAETAVIDELKERNDWLSHNDIVVKKVIKPKNTECEYFDVVLEVDRDCFDKMMDSGRVKMGWRTCRVVHHVHLTRCFKCCGYGHVAEKCTNKQACAKCSGEHKTSDCDKKNKIQCINCKVSNEKFKTKFDTKHRPWNNSCEILKKRTERFTRNFVLNTKQ